MFKVGGKITKQVSIVIFKKLLQNIQLYFVQISQYLLGLAISSVTRTMCPRRKIEQSNPLFEPNNLFEIVLGFHLQ
jgi:hypothetical protein